jgi:signal transduction histidine kinase
MKASRVKRQLLFTVLVMTGIPLVASFYFLNAALERSLNLGFNPQVVRALDTSAANLKALKDADPANEASYRQQFEEVSALRHIYSQSQLLKQTVQSSLRLYFGIGFVGAMFVAVCVAVLLSRSIHRSYRATFDELIAQRDRVTYLEQMASWQELARILAHEIKNPLTPIEVLVTSLSKAYASKTPEQFQQQLSLAQTMIAEELTHLKKTVSRFSEFAKLAEPRLIDEHPAQLVGRHLPAVASMFDIAGIDLDSTACPDETRARMDSSLFRQVLTNIVANGVEANPGRQVAFRIRVSCTPQTVSIELSNDGVPVPPALAARIFDPYVSGSATTANMGLGLSIVKKVVIEHGGQIGYVEQDGHPAFVISLARVA